MNHSEVLTTAFYAWELHGRGWYKSEHPQKLEPKFIYYSHLNFVFDDEDEFNDGLSKPLCKRAFDFLTKTQKTKQEEFDPLAVIHHPTDVEFLEVSQSLVEIQLLVSHDQLIPMDIMHEFLLMLDGCKYHLCFEIIGTKDKIIFQLVCDATDEVFITSHLKIFLPEVIVTRRIGHLETLFEHERETISLGYHFALTNEFVRPLQTNTKHVIDPLSGIYAAFEGIRDGELGIVQIMFKGTEHPWSRSIINAVTDGEGNDFFQDDPSMRKLAEEKISAPLFGVSIRGYTQCLEMRRSHDLLLALYNGLGRVDRTGSNQLTPLEELPLTLEELTSDVFNRTSHYSAMLLNSYELVNLVHLPIQYIPSEKLYGKIRKTKEFPKELVGSSYVLGENIHLGKSQPIALGHQARLRHIHLIGATGSGKTNLIKNLIVQDFNAGTGITVLDPHGDLIDDLIGHIPEHRLQDVILVDPSDLEYPIGLNLLTANSEIEKIVLESDLVSVFKRQATSWGDQMTSILSNAIIAFLESSEGGSLVDLRKFLTDVAFRNEFLKTVEDETVLHFWNKEFNLLRKNTLASILTRLDTFLRPKIIRYMMMQKKGLNFEEIINGNKILLVKLSQGLIGESNSNLLGTLFIAKLNQASQARQQIKAELRSPFYLYIDEFQNFITDSMTSILSGARKYGLGLILAHQDMEQLIAKDREVANSVLSNPYTRICFRCGDTDARKLENGFSYFDASDIQNLQIGQAIIRIGKSDHDGNIDVPLIQKGKNDNKTKIIGLTREKYAVHLSEIKSKPSSSNEQVIKKKETRIQTEGIPLEENPPKINLEESKDKFVQNFNKKQEERKHLVLQTFIKKIAQERGLKAVVEEPTPDGGRVDIGLLANKIRIACEVSVTNTVEYEVQNINKCFNAKYDFVIMVSDEVKHLRKIREASLNKIDKENLPNLFFATSEKFTFELDNILAKSAKKPSVENIGGYRVHVKRNPTGDAKSVLNSVKDTVRNSLKKK